MVCVCVYSVPWTLRSTSLERLVAVCRRWRTSVWAWCQSTRAWTASYSSAKLLQPSCRYLQPLSFFLLFFLVEAALESSRKPEDSVVGPVLPFLVFFGKRQGKPPKKQGFLIPTEPLKSLEKERKTLKKTRNSSQGKNTRNSQKARKGRTGPGTQFSETGRNGFGEYGFKHRAQWVFLAHREPPRSEVSEFPWKPNLLK